MDKEQPPPLALSSQALSLRIDFETRRVLGLATLVLAASTPAAAVPDALRLHCRQAAVTAAFVNGRAAAFVLGDPLAAAAGALAAKTPANHPELRAAVAKAAEAADDDGELLIHVPAELRAKSQGLADPQAEQPKDAFSSITVQIEYELVDPQVGIHFVFPDSGISSAKTPYLYTSNEGKSARFWMPCFDSSSRKASWTVEILTPATFADIMASTQPRKQTKKSKALASKEIIAQCNGSLVECFMDPIEPGWKVTRFAFDGSVCASSILLAVGAFGFYEFGQTEVVSTNAASLNVSQPAAATTVEVPDEDDKEDDEKSDDEDDKEKAEATGDSAARKNATRGVKCEAFFPDELKENVRATLDFLPQAMEFYDQFTGLSFPFPSYKIIFVHDASLPIIIGAGMAIFSTHLLLEEDDIENIFDSRYKFSVALAYQWFGQYVTHRHWTDSWLNMGLGNYMAGLFIRKLLGNNEYRYRLSEDMKRVAAMDVGQLPLCPAYLLNEEGGAETDDVLCTKYFHPSDEPDSLRTEFLSLKAPLVIGMLDQRLGKGNLVKVINKIMISTMSGELENGLSTNHFFKVCRKISASAELKSFADQWIFGSGCPKFKLGFKFSRKKLVVEITIHQDNTNKNHPTATKKFTGPFIVRVHEPKGIAYSHQIFIDEMEKVVEVPYHTKYKRAGQKLKKLQKMGIMTGANGGKADDGADDDDDAPQEFHSSQQPQPGANDGVKDKGKPDLDQFDRRSLDWIRWDPDGDWLCLKVHDQLRSMWIEQLARDLDVVAHHEAVVRLASMPDNLTTMALMRVLTDERHFYRVRMEAAYSLAKLGVDPAMGAPFVKLVKEFNTKYCYERAANSVMTIPKPNDFSNFQDYFVKKAMSTALVTYRDAENKIPLLNKRIVLDLLRFNDNSKNQYSDGYYIAALINALCHATIPQKFREAQAKPKEVNMNAAEGIFEEFDFVGSAPEEPDDQVDFGTEEEKALLVAAVAEIDRYLALDRLNASHHNIVTRTCIEAKMKWMLAGLLPIDLPFFLGFSGYGNFFCVRMTAIDSLLMLDGFYTTEIANYLLQIVEQDVDIRIACYAAKELYNFVVLAKSVGVDEARKKKPRNNAPLHTWASICANITKNGFFSNLLWPLLTSSNLDSRIRLYLLRFCEVVYKPVPFHNGAVAVPKKLVIKMPSLSLTEVPDAIPVPPKSSSKSAPKAQAPRPPPKAPVFTEPFPPIDQKFLETGRKVMMNITNHPSAAAFMLPVDESFAPMYFTLIKKPMDISTTSKKLEAGAYRNNLTFLFSDIQLIFSNCYKYNTDDSPVTKQAQKLERFFNSEIMPRALVHELPILSNAIEIDDDIILGTPTDTVMEDVTPAQPTLPKPKLVIPIPPKPVVPPPAKPPVVQAQVSEKPSPVTPKLTLLPPKPHLATSAAAPSGVKPPAPGLPQKPAVAEPATAEKPVALVPPKSALPVKLSPSVSPAPVKPAAPTASLLPPPSARPPPSKILGPPPSQTASGTPPLPKAILKLKPESEISSTATAPKRKLSLGGETPPHPPSAGLASSSAPPVAARLDSEDYKKCKKIIRHLAEHEKAYWFQTPVDPVAFNLPTYFDVIKEPMDLSTLKTLLTDSKITTIKEFKHAAALIFKNAMAFNAPSTQVYQDAQLLLDMLKTEVRQYFGDSKGDRGGASSSSSGTAKASQPQALPVKPVQQAAPAPSVSNVDTFKSTAAEPAIKKFKLKHDPGSVGGSPSLVSSHSPSAQSAPSSERMVVSSVAGKKCLKVLKKLQNNAFGKIFLAPVDPVALNIPTYLTVIKHPMDLGTINKKLERGSYRDHLGFKADVELMLNNCFVFNVPGDWVYNQGKGLESVFLKEWRDIDWDILPIPGVVRPVGPTIEKTLTKLREHQNAFIFLEPVDPVILPDYYKRIRNPIDLSTMAEKNKRGEYLSLDAFEKDMKLMFANCFSYNEKESLGHNSGLALEKYFKQIFRK
ncbi:hypothetical protein BDR26DRAFT_1012954 [Obelidium mucronatum]|nr:hypothetical protein BDR26DRAFT_1012954 [Obelidium mucronatum]